MGISYPCSDAYSASRFRMEVEDKARGIFRQSFCSAGLSFALQSVSPPRHGPAKCWWYCDSIESQCHQLWHRVPCACDTGL